MYASGTTIPILTFIINKFTRFYTLFPRSSSSNLIIKPLKTVWCGMRMYFYDSEMGDNH